MLISIVPKPNKINFVFLQFCHDQVIFYQDLLLLLMVMFLFLLILGLKFGLNRINDRWNIVVIVGLVVVVIVVVDPRNLPLKLCQNWGSNCYDIVVFVVADIFVIHLKFGQNCVSDRWNKLGLSCAKLSLASAKLHASLSSDQLKLATH